VICIEETRPVTLLVKFLVGNNRNQISARLYEGPPICDGLPGILHMFQTMGTVDTRKTLWLEVIQNFICIPVLLIEWSSVGNDQIWSASNIEYAVVHIPGIEFAATHTSRLGCFVHLVISLQD
jgi:hypothetical protein